MSEHPKRIVGIAAKPQPSGSLPLLDALLAWIEASGNEAILEPAAQALTSDRRWRNCERADLPTVADIVVVLGGDGTLLSVARHSSERPVPILGVNLGNLGFLTEVSAGEMVATLEDWVRGNAPVQPRMMLRASLVRGGKEVGAFHCLNDVVLNKAALARMVEVRVEVGGVHLTTMRADGLIVATPTGSTAYNLSAGGPILIPGMNGIILTPLCPHTLTMRPLVVDGRSPVAVTLSKDSGEVFLTADGQTGQPVFLGDSVLIERSPHKVHLVSSRTRSYYTLLRDKLGWGTRYP